MHEAKVFRGNILFIYFFFVCCVRRTSIDIATASEVVAYGWGRRVTYFHASHTFVITLCPSPLPSSGSRWLYVEKCDGVCLSFTFSGNTQFFHLQLRALSGWILRANTWAEIRTVPRAGYLRKNRNPNIISNVLFFYFQIHFDGGWGSVVDARVGLWIMWQASL